MGELLEKDTRPIRIRQRIGRSKGENENRISVSTDKHSTGHVVRTYTVNEYLAALRKHPKTDSLRNGRPF